MRAQVFFEFEKMAGFFIRELLLSFLWREVKSKDSQNGRNQSEGHERIS